MTSKCLIALGANLPTSTRAPLEVLAHALELMKGESIDATTVSRWYASPAFPKGSGPDYVNAVAMAETVLTPREVLVRLAHIETKLGRVREKRWDARVCDLDLLSFGDTILPDLATYSYWRNLAPDAQREETPDELILPHPRLEDRAFVLIPLRDVCPNWVHPVTGTSLLQLIESLPKEDVEAMRQLPNPQKPSKI